MAHEYIKESDTFNTLRNGTVPKPTAQDVSDGKVLGAGGNWVSGGGGGGGSSTLAGLDDVALSNLSDGQIIKYDSFAQKWKNANESGGGSTTLEGLDDVVIQNAANGDTLEYDSLASKWKNKAKEQSKTTRLYYDSFTWQRGSSSGSGSSALAYTYTSQYDGWFRTWVYITNTNNQYISLEGYIYDADNDTEWQMDMQNGIDNYHTWNITFPVKKGDVIRIRTRLDGTATLPTADVRIFG